MSRLLLLIPFMLWLSVPPGGAHAPGAPNFYDDAVLFLTGYLFLVLALGIYSRLIARRIGLASLNRYLKLFNKVAFAARLAVPAWFAAGMYLFHWRAIAGPLNSWPAQLPGMLVGTLPALLAWVGLWWAQYPADRAMREQSILYYLDEGLPIHAPPTLRSYIISNLRLQLLFTLVPALFIMGVHDLVICTVPLLGLSVENSEMWEGLSLLFASAMIFVFSPEILRRVLQTEPLPNSPLREKLEMICQRLGLGYRDILLWHTQNNMGNAAVMGIFPQLRYILLSDLLLETMTEEQIEAVFAHEVGHIVHWHLAWFVVLFLTLFSMLTVVTGLLPDKFNSDEWITGAGAVLFVLLFGYLSQKFERQADVFAARTLERDARAHPPSRDPAPYIAVASETNNVASSGVADMMLPQTIAIPSADYFHESHSPRSHVGPHGASVFASALYRVAVVNNIPISSWNWTHGSIEKRMDYLKSISSNPAHTADFDRLMFRLYVIMLVLLGTFGVWAAVQVVRGA